MFSKRIIKLSRQPFILITRSFQSRLLKQNFCTKKHLCHNKSKKLPPYYQTHLHKQAELHPSDKLTTCRFCARCGFPARDHPSDKLTTCRGYERCSFPFISSRLGLHPSDKLTTCRGCAHCGFPFISSRLGTHPSDKFTPCRGYERCSFPFISSCLGLHPSDKLTTLK